MTGIERSTTQLADLAVTMARKELPQHTTDREVAMIALNFLDDAKAQIARDHIRPEA